MCLSNFPCRPLIYSHNHKNITKSRNFLGKIVRYLSKKEKCRRKVQISKRNRRTEMLRESAASNSLRGTCSTQLPLKGALFVYNNRKFVARFDETIPREMLEWFHAERNKIYVEEIMGKAKFKKIDCESKRYREKCKNCLKYNVHYSQDRGPIPRLQNSSEVTCIVRLYQVWGSEVENE